VFQVFKTFLRILRDPEGYRQQQLAEYKAECQRILTEAAEVGIDPKSKGELQRFQKLADALDFIVDCLENNDVTKLGSEMAWSAHLDQYPDRPYYFKHYFSQRKDRHQDKDIRSIYQDREFPANDVFFQLGGSLSSQLGHFYIRFEKVSDGWLIDDIGMVR
jgi:hypothetical protein